MARFSHSLSLLRCQASRDIKIDPLATHGHDCKREAQWGTRKPMPKGRETEGQTFKDHSQMERVIKKYPGGDFFFFLKEKEKP